MRKEKKKKLSKTSIVITVKNEISSIQDLLDFLEKQTIKPREIIIVDGGSADGTIEIIKRRMKKNKLIRLMVYKDISRAKGRNIGIMNSKSDIIAITDAGGYPKSNWLEKITIPFLNSNINAVSGYYQAKAMTVFEKCVTPYFLVMPNKIKFNREFLPSSRSVAFRKSIWEKVGGYPQKFLYNEDLVFDYNLKKAGVSFYFEPKAIVVWFPPNDLLQTGKKLLNFARGDAQAGIPRPMVKLIFFRYGVGFFLVVFKFYQIFVFLVLFYILWAILKNFRYAKFFQALFWLPVIQIISDVAIMIGTVLGKVGRNENLNCYSY